MFTKLVRLAVLAACGVQAKQATAPGEPDDRPPGDAVEEGQHFCCDSVDLKSKSGEGCVTLAAGQIDLCPDVLYCSGDWGKTGNTTKCL
jgi:hypothetical protein